MNCWLDATQLIVLSREPDTLWVLASLSGGPCQGAEEGAMVGCYREMARLWVWVQEMGVLSCGRWRHFCHCVMGMVGCYWVGHPDNVEELFCEH